MQRYWVGGSAVKRLIEPNNPVLRALRQAGADGIWISKDQEHVFVTIDQTRLKMRKPPKRAKYEALLQNKNHTYGLLNDGRYVILDDEVQQSARELPPMLSKNYIFVPISEEIEDDLSDLQLTEADLTRSLAVRRGVGEPDLAVGRGRRASAEKLKAAGCESSAPD